MELLMAYDRYDERSRWSGDHHSERDRDWRGEDRGRRDERGFFERAGDEVASWFGDDDAERRRREDQMMNEGGRGWQRNMSGSRNRDEDRFRDRGRDYRPMTGDYGRSDRFSSPDAGEM